MTAITAAMVKDLREKTGAGMMDCKSALAETAGDIEAAVDWLRKKGLSKAAKKSGRVAAEGLVSLAVQGKQGVVVEVNSETDFVARNEHFQGLARNIALVALKVGDDVETIKTSNYPDGGTVNDAISHAIATIGENMTLRRAKHLSVSEGVVSSYIHNSSGEGLGRIGVLVALQSSGNADELGTLGRQIAMHIAASNPLALDASGMDAEIVKRESAILAEKNAGKPANILEKIIENGLKSYYKEVCLVDQPFVHDASKTVAQAIKEFEGKAGAPITLTAFVRYGLGDGIEKEENDFAAEVAAAANG